MIRSMTAFARRDAQGDWGTLTCEIRTVNHRYLEPSFRLPEAFRELENRFREELRKQLKRGKVDVSMRLQSAEKGSQSFEISEDMAQAVNEAANHINRILDNPAHINALDILRWPGVLSVPEQDYSPANSVEVTFDEPGIYFLAGHVIHPGDRVFDPFGSIESAPRKCHLRHFVSPTDSLLGTKLQVGVCLA